MKNNIKTKTISMRLMITESQVKTLIDNIKSEIKSGKIDAATKISHYRKLRWFLNKKRGRNDLFFQVAPLKGGMLQLIPSKQSLYFGKIFQII